MSFKGIPTNTQRALELLDKQYSDILKPNDFYLAGGTSLALQFSYRISYDLDFFSSQDFDPEKLLKNFSHLELNSIEVSKGTLKFSLYECAISFFSYPYKLIEEFTILDTFNIPLANKLDVALMKITAIADRGLRKDFIDLYYIAKNFLDLKNIFEKFKEKYPQSNYYHYLKALTYFDDADNDPNVDLLIPIDWEEVKKYFLENVKNLI